MRKAAYILRSLGHTNVRLNCVQGEGGYMYINILYMYTIYNVYEVSCLSVFLPVFLSLSCNTASWGVFHLKPSSDSERFNKTIIRHFYNRPAGLNYNYIDTPLNAAI